MEPLDCLCDHRVRVGRGSTKRMVYAESVPGSRNQKKAGLCPVCHFEKGAGLLVTHDVVVAAVYKQHRDLQPSDAAEQVVSFAVLLKVVKHRHLVPEQRPRWPIP